MGSLNPLFTLIREFFTAYLPNERKCSPNTIRSYQKALELLLDYTKDKKRVPLRKVTFDMIDRKLLSEFLDFLENERKCSVSTRNHRLNCIRAFYNFAAESDISLVSYWEEIKKVDTANVPEQLVAHMSETAVDILLAQPNVTTRKGRRDMLLMLFLFKTGARIQEALDVRLSDIQFGKHPKVTLNGKGSKPRNVPLRDNVSQHVEAYIKLFHPTENQFSEQHLFYVIRGGTKKRMTEGNARHLVSKYGVAARRACSEVPESVHPHLLRHSFAMCLYQNGADLSLVSQWLGHADLETTLIYARADTEMKRKAMEKSIPDDSPLNRHINLERFRIDDESELKRLCGLK